MIFTILYLSSLIHDDEKKCIYAYAIGSIVYTILHWFLFSSLGSNFELIHKYKHAMYVIIAMDLCVLGYKIKNNPANFKCALQLKHALSNDVGTTAHSVSTATQKSSNANGSSLDTKSDLNRNNDEQPLSNTNVGTSKCTPKQRDNISEVSIPIYTSGKETSDATSIELPIYIPTMDIAH